MAALYFVFYFFFLEVAFALSTGGHFFSRTTLYMLLFSISYGLLFTILTSFFKNSKINRNIRRILSFLCFLPYPIAYYINCEFGVFYDLKTVLGGAGDAVGGFSSDIFKLIFCASGLFHLFLFLLPVIIYVVFAKYDEAKQMRWSTRFILLGFGTFTYLIAVLVINDSTVHKAAYSEEYNYSAAVSDFGIATATRLEVKNLFVGDDADFDMTATTFEYNKPTPEPTPVPPADDVTDTDIVAEVTQAPEPTPIVYGKNELDIDFALLSENASKDVAKLDNYVASLSASSKNEYTGLFEGKNMIMISAEAFTAEAIDPERTPTLYRMATQGIQILDYYQPASAGTTGGEYSNIFGMLPTAGGKSMKNMVDTYNYYTLGTQFDMLGYYGKAYHNNDYTYYSRDKTHICLGYSDGFTGKGNGMEPYLSKCWPESDLEMMQCTVPSYIDRQPFNIYYMSVSGHSLYTHDSNAMARKHWDMVENLPYSEPVKGYLACQIELDAALEYLIGQLEKKGIADDTVICISADHFPYGLDTDSTGWDMPYLNELYGYEVHDYLTRDHNRLIIWSGCLEDMDPIVVEEPTFSCDILPTLYNLFGIEFDSRLLVGRDILSDAMPLIFNLSYDWKTDLGTYIASTGTFTPVSDEVEIPEDYVKIIKSIVANKISYMKSVPTVDYYRHVFGSSE